MSRRTPPQGHEKEEGKISRADLEAHSLRFGRGFPCFLPMTGRMDDEVQEKPPEIAGPIRNEGVDKRYAQVGPLDTTGLMEKLIHTPGDVNSH